MSIPKVKRPHIGRKIERIRELRGMKQETLAASLGITQQAVSKIEQSEDIEDEKLDRIAVALGVSSETIRNFNEEMAIYNVQNSYDNATNNIHYQLSPVEKIVELYERSLKVEQEKVATLEAKVARLEAALQKVSASIKGAGKKNPTGRKK